MIASVPETSAIARAQPARDARWAQLTRLYRDHASLVFRFLRRRGIPEGELDDVLQETFLVAWRKLETLRDDASPRIWLLGIAYRVASHSHRARKKLCVVAPEGTPQGVEHATPEATATTREAAALVSRFLDGLEPRRREVFFLSEVEGLTAPEIGSIMGANLNTTYTRIRAARRAFREFVHEQGEHHDGRL
jgi:RNA polymerase sigma-70 factor (ECF subfamily)